MDLPGWIISFAPVVTCIAAVDGVVWFMRRNPVFEDPVPSRRSRRRRNRRRASIR
jgi:hypothetical protein